METVCIYATAISCFPLGGNGKNHAGLHLRNRVQKGGHPICWHALDIEVTFSSNIM